MTWVVLTIDRSPGPAPSVIKHTQGILMVGSDDEFSKENDQWDIRVVGKENDTITLQVGLISVD